MPASTFQYLASGTWTTENNYIRMTITDTIYFPMTLEASIANSDGAGNFNTRETVYDDFQEVRVIEGNSNRIIFHGRIEKIEPEFDNAYGQVVKIYARDNLQELLKHTIDRQYSGNTVRSAQISSIVADHTLRATSIATADTDKYTTSTQTFGATELNQDFRGAGVNALRAIAEHAQADESSDDSGWAYHLDQEFDALTSSTSGNAIPDLHYYVRGARPPGGPLTNGLQVQFQGADDEGAGRLRSILPDYAFPKHSRELVTKARIIYTDEDGANQELHAILVNHGTVTAGPFVVGNTVTWPGGGSGRIEFVGTDFLLIGPDSGNTDVTAESDYLVTVVGQLLTSGGTTATANTATAPDSTPPPGSIRESINQEIEKTARHYGDEHITGARRLAKEFLYEGTGTIQRGNFKILRWPYSRFTGTHTGASGAAVLTDSGGDFIDDGIFIGDEVRNTTDNSVAKITARTATTITGTLAGGTENDWDDGDAYRVDVLVRAGHSIRLISIPGVTDQNALVTNITYDEGPGIQQTQIEVLFHASGRGLPLPYDVLQRNFDRIENSEWQTTGSVGEWPLAASLVDLTNVFSVAAAPNNWNRIDWTAGTATFSDGTSQTIDSGNRTFPADTLEYFYIIRGNTTLQTTTSFATVVGLDNLLAAIGGRNREGTSTAHNAFIVSLNGGNPVMAANTIIANEISAISANMGTLTAGTIRMPTGSVANTDTAGFTGFLLTGSQIAGYNAGTLQAEIRSSDGKAYFSAGNVVADVSGIQIIGTTTTGLVFRPTQDDASADGYLAVDGSGNFLLQANDTTNDLRLRSFGGNVRLQPGAGGIEILSESHHTLTDQHELRLREDSGSGTNYVGFVSATTLAGNVIWTLPSVNGSANDVLGISSGTTLAFLDPTGTHTSGHDSRYVNVTGDGMTGDLDSTNNSNLGDATNYWSTIFSTTVQVNTLQPRLGSRITTDSLRSLSTVDTIGESETVNYYASLFVNSVYANNIYPRTGSETTYRGHLHPDVTGTHDLGSSTLLFRDLWISRDITCNGFIEMQNISDPSTPQTNEIRLFVRDDSGTLRFEVIWDDGSFSTISSQGDARS